MYQYYRCGRDTPLSNRPAKVTKDGEDEAKAYKEYFEWCDEVATNNKHETQTASNSKDPYFKGMCVHMGLSILFYYVVACFQIQAGAIILAMQRNARFATRKWGFPRITLHGVEVGVG